MPRWTPDARVDGLGELLRDAGFTAETAARSLHAATPADLLTNSALYAATSPDDLTGTLPGILAHLFICNAALPSATYEKSVPASLREAFEALHLLVRERDSVRSLVSLSPFDSMYFLSDPLFRTANGAITMTTRRDLVMPPHASSLLLLENVAAMKGRLLDIGCGSGFLALSLADRYDSVIGVDINPRAVAYSRANAVLNGRAATFTLGDLATDLRVHPPADHVIFNSPTGPTHRDDDREPGWMAAPTALTTLVERLPSVLAGGGSAQILLIAELPREGPALPLPSGYAATHIRAFPESQLAVPENSVTSGRIDPGCLLVRDSADARRLMAHLHANAIRAVHPVLLTLSN
ncbi:methyltransferase [Actinomadura gamaensis]|uniref:Methyltransferase n=1 Tax=Actinomadura gamaensis TaxID=1763541 RepID=A0ABV9TXJ9_9ACTN